MGRETGRCFVGSQNIDSFPRRESGMGKSLGVQPGHHAMAWELVHDAPPGHPSKNPLENQALDEGELVLRVKTCSESRDSAK